MWLRWIRLGQDGLLHSFCLLGVAKMRQLSGCTWEWKKSSARAYKRPVGPLGLQKLSNSDKSNNTMFKLLLAFFALVVCAMCAPSPVPAPAPKPGLALTYPVGEIPLAYEYRYPALSYAKTYSYGNLGLGYYPSSYYYNAPLYTI
ncbi:hypothetical protein HUJ04_008465 [Dendroctonus ponderosae]|nr:hypothetical protein HUJ04_008465 [Dendroctonus ponderosae]